MKSFLLNSQYRPIVKWGLIPQNCFFEGPIPEGFFLAVAPSENIVILDVDNKNNKYGYDNIPHLIQMELDKTFHYKTKSGGAHYWIEYTGNKTLLNTSTPLGLDLRIGAIEGNCGGYVRYQHNADIRQCIHLINKSSDKLNIWLEKLFQGVKYEK